MINSTYIFYQVDFYKLVNDSELGVHVNVTKTKLKILVYVPIKDQLFTVYAHSEIVLLYTPILFNHYSCLHSLINLLLFPAF